MDSRLDNTPPTASASADSTAAAPVEKVEHEDIYNPPTPAEPVATVPRTTLNYFIIAVVFFVLGGLVGFVAYDRVAQQNRDENRALINQAVAQAVAALGANDTADAGPQLDPTQRYTIDEAGNPAIGPEDAPVLIVEFGDFRCGFCKRFQDETIQPLLDRYAGRVRFVWRDYPILGQSSLDSSIAGECADDQGKFWEFHDLIFGDQANLTREGFLAKAESLGLDMAAFTTCYDEQTHMAEITADYEAGAALGVGGTPTFFINGRPLIGAQPIDAFVRIIEEELASS